MPLWMPEWVVTLVGRPLCWVGWHNVTCRGRSDHKTAAQCRVRWPYQ